MGRTDPRPAEPEAPPPVGRSPLYDRLDGLAARATPPGGEARATTGLAPAVSPSEVAHEAIGVYEDSYDQGPYDDTYGKDDLDDDELDRSKRRGCGRLSLVMLVVAGLLCMTLLGGGIWVRRQINPGGSPGEVVSVEVRRGQSTSDIGQSLEEQGVITSAAVWTWYVRFRGGGDIQAGTYELRQNLSMGEALDTLTGGSAAADPHSVTIPEGLTRDQIMARLVDPEEGVEGFTREGLDAALLDPSVRSSYLPQEQANLEGTLYPETYTLGENPTELDLLQRMAEEFDATLDQMDIEAGAQGVGRSVYDVLIIASLVEEEARVPEERPQVARVIYNRLAQDIPLQIDATSCYAKGEVPCQLTASDLDSDSPYNTRHDGGLPPTPISSPGAESIEAALNPADGNWLYYVLDPEIDPEGQQHLFTASEEEFLAAKARCEAAGLGCG